jgi:hypothetical protein
MHIWRGSALSTQVLACKLSKVPCFWPEVFWFHLQSWMRNICASDRQPLSQSRQLGLYLVDSHHRWLEHDLRRMHPLYPHPYLEVFRLRPPGRRRGSPTGAGRTCTESGAALRRAKLSCRKNVEIQVATVPTLRSTPHLAINRSLQRRRNARDRAACSRSASSIPPQRKDVAPRKPIQPVQLPTTFSGEP